MLKNKWTYTEYEIIQLLPADQYQGVWYFDGSYDSENPLPRLEVEDIDFLAVAKAIDVHMEADGRDDKGHPINPREYGRDERHEVVAVELTDCCGFEVCESSRRFSGIIRRGTEPDVREGRGTYHLDVDLLEKLLPAEPASD